MIVLRISSAVGLVYLLYMLSQEPEHISNLKNFTSENMEDLFNWGNDRFVMGRIEDQNMNKTARKKTAQEVFMEVLLGDENEKTQQEDKKEDEPEDRTEEEEEKSEE